MATVWGAVSHTCAHSTLYRATLGRWWRHASTSCWAARAAAASHRRVHTRPHLPHLATPTGADRKYFMLGGKGGVGKTSCASSLAVKFASEGLPTLVVSTDPAHSLSDSFDQVRKKKSGMARGVA